MWARPSAFSARLPVSFFGRRSTSSRCVSVPPETRSKPERRQHLAQRLGVLHHGARVGLELRPQRLAERHRLGGDDVHQRAALHAGEDGRVDLLGEVLLVGEDHGAARAAQGLVRGRGDDVRVRERRGMRAAGDQPGEVRHVDHQVGADLVGDLAEGGEVDDARIGAAAGDDHLRPVLAREAPHLVHVDAVVLAAHRVGHHLEPLARQVDRRAVRQMPAGRQRQPHEGVARLHQRHERGLVGGARRSAAARWRSLHLNSCLARSMASVSTSSTYWQPP